LDGRWAQPAEPECRESLHIRDNRESASKVLKAMIMRHIVADGEMLTNFLDGGKFDRPGDRTELSRPSN